MSTKTTTATTALVCECCAVALVNADTSGCAANCRDQHVERVGLYPSHPEATLVVYLDMEGPTHHGAFECAGCGESYARDYAGRVELLG